MRCMSSGRVMFLLFKLCCGCVEVCQKAKKKAERPRAHARISDDKRALILAWHALGRSSQEMATNLHVSASTAHKMFKEPVKVLHQVVNMVA